MKYLKLCGSRLAVMAVLLIVAILAPERLASLMFIGLAGATTTAFNAGGASDINQALKIFFNEPVAEDIVYDTELLSLFQEDNNVKQDESTGGRYIETAQYFQLSADGRAAGQNK